MRQDCVGHLGAPVLENFQLALVHRLHDVRYNVELNAPEEGVYLEWGLDLDDLGQHLAHLGRLKHAAEYGGELVGDRSSDSDEWIVTLVDLSFKIEQLFKFVQLYWAW